MAPPRRPRSISSRVGRLEPPALISARGVAEATRSVTTGRVPPATPAEKDIRSITLAVAAGLAKLQPSPPNIHFTTTMAKIAPTAVCHRVTVVGRVRARIRPVTAADRSDTVCSLRHARQKSISEPTAHITDTAMMSRARSPYSTTEATAPGARAISTSRIIF